MEFVNRLRTRQGIRLVISEGRLEGDDWDLGSVEGVYRHFKFTYPNVCWLKENLINTIKTTCLPRYNLLYSPKMVICTGL